MNEYIWDRRVEIMSVLEFKVAQNVNTWGENKFGLDSEDNLLALGKKNVITGW